MARSECGKRVSDVSATGKSVTARLLTPISRGFLGDSSRDVGQDFFGPPNCTQILFGAPKNKITIMCSAGPYAPQLTAASELSLPEPLFGASFS